MGMEKKFDKEEQEALEKKVKEEIERQNKLLKIVLIVLGGAIVIFLIVYLYMGSLSHFNYKGVGFVTEKYCDAKPCLTLYKTSIPVITKDSVTGKSINADYNIWFRNNPKEIGEVPVTGNITFRPNMVISIDDEKLFCDGDRVIAIGNMNNLKIFGIKLMMKNESEINIYMPQDQYMFVNIKEANKTGIVQTSDNSYDINVANCEVLKATERLMLDAFVQYDNESY